MGDLEYSLNKPPGIGAKLILGLNRALKLVPESPPGWVGPLGVGPCGSGPLSPPVQPGGDFEVLGMKLQTRFLIFRPQYHKIYAYSTDSVTTVGKWRP